MTLEMVDSLVQLLAAQSTYYLDELQYYILSKYQLWVSESKIYRKIKEVAFTRKVTQLKEYKREVPTDDGTYIRVREASSPI